MSDTLARTALSRLTDLKARWEARFTTVEADVAANTGDITALDGRLDAAETQLGNLAAETAFGASSGTTNGSGDLTIAHGMGGTPTVVVGTARASSAVVRVQTKDGTNIVLRFLAPATGAAITGTSVGVDWIAAR